MEKDTKDLVDRLRDLATIPGKQRTWISQLRDTQLYELFLRLRNGEKSRLVARYAHDVWKVNPTSTVHSLSQGVTKFRKRISHLFVAALPVTNGPYLEDSATECSLESLVALSDELERRIKKIIKEEEQSGVRFPLNKEITALSSLRKTILKEKQWELMHSNDDPINTKRHQNMKQKNEQRFQKLLACLPDEGARICQASQRLLERLDEIAVPMRFNPETGRYQRIPEEELDEDED